MHDGTVVARDRDKRAALGSADGRSCLALEVFDAVCILHVEKVYFYRESVKAAAPLERLHTVSMNRAQSRFL